MAGIADRRSSRPPRPASFVKSWNSKLKQIEFGAHRKTCEWNYTLPEERLNVIKILLPDAQSMRHGVGCWP